jgi:hypothetical protein
MTQQADIEGLPEITVTLSLPTGAATGKPTARVEDFIVDSRVRATDVTALKKLTFTPPLGQYPLCTYTVTSLPKLPLRGFYQMKVGRATSVRHAHTRTHTRVQCLLGEPVPGS